MDLLKDLKISFLNFSFVMIYIIHKMLVLLKNHLNYFKKIFSNSFLRSIIEFYFFLLFLFTTYNDGKSKALKKDIPKDIRSLFRLEKRTKLHCN